MTRFFLLFSINKVNLNHQYFTIDTLILSFFLFFSKGCNGRINIEAVLIAVSDVVVALILIHFIVVNAIYSSKKSN